MRYWKWIVVCILVFGIGFLIGFQVGEAMTIKIVVQIAQHFVDIDEDMIKWAIDAYNSDYGKFLPQNITA